MEDIPFRARCTPELIAVAADRYGLDATDEPIDAGGINLNLHFPQQGGVLRVYAPWVTESRVRFIQAVRAALRDAGLPFTRTIETADGDTLVTIDGRVAEMDVYVEGGSNMDQHRQLEPAMAMLGRIHTEMARLDLGPSDATYPNHIEAADALASAGRTAAIVASWPHAPDEARTVAAGLVELAQTLAPLEAALAPRQRRQLVHGDFWDNNVLFGADGEVVAVLDLDFAGWRPRIDDVALTFYYTTSEHHSETLPDEHYQHLARGLDAYDDALGDKLSAEERAAVPLAVARTVLFVTRHFNAVEDAARQRTMLHGIATDVRWSLAQAAALASQRQ